MLAENHQTVESYSKMLQWTKGVTDVEIQVFFQQYENNLYRISLRSDVHDVAKIAQHFKGGGHIKAAGFSMTGEIDEIKREVIDYIESLII
jgi:phosphoesterase RecJ-like protein